jgi:hypothetical protein
MSDVVVEYIYSYMGIARHQKTIELLREQSVREIEMFKGKTINGCRIDNVLITEKDTPFPRVEMSGVFV